MPTRFLPLLAVAGLLAPLAPVAAPSEVALTVGDGWAVVREIRTVTFTNREQNFTWTDIPAEGDLSSLTPTASPDPVRLLSWARAPAVARPRKPDEDGTFHWTPQAAPYAPLAGALSCRLQSPVLGARRVEMGYLVAGVSWQVNYNVLIRGDLADAEERLSVDVEGNLRIRNDTGRAFRDAQINVVGTERVAGPEARSAAGFLMMEDHPLADLWMQRTPAPGVSHLYPVPDRVSLPAGAAKEVTLVRLLRRPAERLYFMRASEYPMASADRMQPLRRMVVLKNQPSVGVAAALPAGASRVFLGNMRAALSQLAWFSHTPAREELRIDFGMDEGVVGARHGVGREALPGGYRNDEFSFMLENRLATRVQVEIEEVPPTALEWQLVRASAPSTIRGRHIVFTTALEPRSKADVRYTVRVREPTL